MKTADQLRADLRAKADDEAAARLARLLAGGRR